MLAKATEKGLIPDEFKISDFDKEMIKKSKLLERSWHDEWEQYKTKEKQLQTITNKEDTDKAKDILGF